MKNIIFLGLILLTIQNAFGLDLELWKANLAKAYNIPQIKPKKPLRIAYIDTGFKREDQSKFFNNVINIDLTKNLKIKTNTELHGTHVGGILSTLNPYSIIVSYQVEVNSDQYIRALDHAINELHADVINLSLSDAIFYKPEYDLFKKAEQLNIPIVVAAGNNKSRLSLLTCTDYPACYKKYFKNVIVVGNIDLTDYISLNSNYGELVDFYFYGTQIKSLAQNFGMTRLSGTSQATPFITSIVAQALGSQKDKSLDFVKNFISKNVQKYDFQKDYDYTEMRLFNNRRIASDKN